MAVEIGRPDILAILPIIVLSVFGIGLMILGAFWRYKNKQPLLYIALAGIVISALSNYYLLTEPYSAFYGLVKVDRISVLFNLIFLAAAGLCLLMVRSYSDQEPLEYVEFLPLSLFATIGMMLMGQSASLMTVFLGLETMSIAVYVMAGFRRFNRRSLESALKYFLLGAFATGFFLYGIALLYGVIGTTNLAKFSEYFSQHAFDPNVLALIGIGLVIVGFGFKVALVPFHMWTPDVYQGAPIPVTAYMAVGVKAAGFAAILRVITQASGSISFHWIPVLWVLAVLTMTVGNIIALAQDDVKRMLAYSSIAHAGYILMGVVAANDLTVSSVIFYLVIYLLMNLGAFSIASLVSGKGEDRVKIKDFAGLGRSHPLLGIAMTVCMFSLAGFPPTGGFIGKFYLFSAAFQSGFLWLVIFGAINTLISVYYYVGVVVAMYMQKPEGEYKISPVLPGIGFVIFVSVIGIFYLGIFPGQLLEMLY